MITITPESPDDGAAVETLVETCFGPGRHTKAAARLREGLLPVPGLSYVAHADGRVRGSVRFWPIVMDGRPALLLGPLAVDPLLRGRGAGIGLMMVALARAARLGHKAVMLVGDEPYYARVGFRKAEPGRFQLEWPVDPKRLLIRELVPGALDGARGVIAGDRAASAAFAGPGQCDEPARQKERKPRRKKRVV